MRTHALGIGPRRYFTAQEFRRACKITSGLNVCYNGITFAVLRHLYRRPIYHKMGVGFFYYPASPKLPPEECQLP